LVRAPEVESSTAAAAIDPIIYINQESREVEGKAEEAKYGAQSRSLSDSLKFDHARALEAELESESSTDAELEQRSSAPCLTYFEYEE
jgi:hypothetical protein